MKDKLMKENLLKAINDIDFDNICVNQVQTLEKALVMLRVKWEKNNATNLICSGYKTNIPLWDWSEKIYTISKKTVPLDFTDWNKLIGKIIIDTLDDSKHLITSVYGYEIHCGDVHYTYSTLYERCAFSDGSSISKEVEV